MLLKRCESMTRQPQRFNELKPDDDSFQPPFNQQTVTRNTSVSSRIKASSDVLLAHRAVTKPTCFTFISFHLLLPQLGFSATFSLSRLMHLHNYKQGSDFADTRHVLTFLSPHRLWGSPPPRMNGGLHADFDNTGKHISLSSYSSKRYYHI